jgi:hypothetical protein
LVSLLAGAEGFVLLQIVQTASKVQPGRKTDHSPNAEIKNAWNYTSTLIYAFMVHTGTTVATERMNTNDSTLLITSHYDY